jgi:hypothetical protein
LMLYSIVRKELPRAPSKFNEGAIYKEYYDWSRCPGLGKVPGYRSRNYIFPSLGVSLHNWLDRILPVDRHAINSKAITQQITTADLPHPKQSARTKTSGRRRIDRIRTNEFKANRGVEYNPSYCYQWLRRDLLGRTPCYQPQAEI